MIVYLGYLFVYFLVAVDRKWRGPVSWALLPPALWLAMVSSRPASFWFGGGSSISLSERNTDLSNLDGSPINVVVLGALLVSSIWILVQRKVDWGEFISKNKGLIALYLFYAVSSLWSPFPVPTLKRLVNNFGCVLVALVFLSEKKPADALRAVCVRVAYLLLPMSIILIRYVPRIGRTYDEQGDLMVTGVADHKNVLGIVSALLGIMILWDLWETWKGRGAKTILQKACLAGIFLNAMYLLVISDSKTALICFSIGAAFLFASNRLSSFKNPTQLFATGVIAICCFLFLNGVFDIQGMVLEALDRDPSLTGRTEIWDAIMSKDIHSMLGSGYRAFWETSIGVSVWEGTNRHRLLSAHNGYLENYLNGGIVGMVLLVVWLLVSGHTAVVKLINGDPLGKVAIGCWAILLISNSSESSFFMQTTLWFMSLVVLMEYRGTAENVSATAERPVFAGANGLDSPFGAGAWTNSGTVAFRGAAATRQLPKQRHTFKNG